MGPNETETANLKSYLEVADDWEKKMKKATQRRGGKNTTHSKKKTGFKIIHSCFHTCK